MSSRNRLAAVAVGLVASATFAAQACGSSEASSFDSANGASEPDATTAPDVLAPDVVVPDAAPDGEVVTDGGGNFPEGGEDAGDCADTLKLVDDGLPTQSDCRSALPALQGGALVPGTYHLVEVHALASKTFCETQFTPVAIGGTAVLTQGDAGQQLVFEAVFTANGGQLRSRSVLTPAAGNTSPLQADPVCPDKAPGNVRFTSTPGVNPQRQKLVVLLPYGAGAALYHFDKML